MIDVVDFAAERNGERDINPAKLRGVVETFSDPRYRLGLADVQPDFLGRAYEYLLRKFAEGSGQSAGEFFTPTEVGFLMAHIMRPKPGRGLPRLRLRLGGAAGQAAARRPRARPDEQGAAQALRPGTAGRELRRRADERDHPRHGRRARARRHDDQSEVPRRPTARSGRYDIVVANPMWNQPFDPDVFANDPFDRFRTPGGVTTGKGDWAWLQHTLACMNERGRAAVVLDTGAVTRGSGSKNEDKERNIRKWFVDHDLIDGVILLPDNLFYNTTAAGVIVVLYKRKPPRARTRSCCSTPAGEFSKGRPKNYLPEEDIRPLAAALPEGRASRGRDRSHHTAEQAEEADYNLSPSRWVSQSNARTAIPIATLIEQARALSDEGRAIDQQLFALLAPLETGNDRQFSEVAG